MGGTGVLLLCFGGNVFGWTADEPTSFALLDRFADAVPATGSRWPQGRSVNLLPMLDLVLTDGERQALDDASA